MKEYTIIVHRRDRKREVTGTLAELTSKFGYTLEVGKSWEREKGNHKINTKPGNIRSLVANLNYAESNRAANGCASTLYSIA